MYLDIIEQTDLKYEFTNVNKLSTDSRNGVFTKYILEYENFDTKIENIKRKLGYIKNS